jgi:4-hydroxy-2-oxoheptanedioate aldolase
MSTQSYRLRRELRAGLLAGKRLIGTFVKLPVLEVIEILAAADYAFAVIDLEHSTLTEADAIALVRHADLCGLPAVVRTPTVDPALINRLLENGAVGIQVSMMRSAAQSKKLRDATRFAPFGMRSMSTTNRVAGSGSMALAEILSLERDDPPLLVGQIETATTDPVTDVVVGLDVCFVGITDLAVDLGLVGDEGGLSRAVADICTDSAKCGVTIGGWASSLSAVGGLGLDHARYLVVGSDMQSLSSGLRAPKVEDLR